MLTISFASTILDRKTDSPSWFGRVVSALVFTSGHILLVYPINLMVAYPLNENMPRLLATFENWGREVAKQLLIIFLALFEPEPVAA